MLYGRENEQMIIDRLLRDARDGRAGALVVRGEAGIGKSALLDHAATTSQARVLRVSGVESEATLPFAALQLLLRSVLDRIKALPRNQADALLGALGAVTAAPAERYLIGLATLGLLTELSADGPLLCLVDDAHWLDRESADALLFAARRLHAEPVAVIFAARDEVGAFPASVVPELRLGGLTLDAARQLLAGSDRELALAVREQVVAEAQGNPLALLELPRTEVFAPLALSLGGEPVTGRVVAGFRARLGELPAAARTCVLVAALEDTGALDTLTRALRELGGSLTDFAPAERAGLITVTEAGLRFRHPLVRTAARLSADVAQRMAAHQALAKTVDDDRRAWHLAAVTTEPDEQVAAALETSATRARHRGGQATAAAAYTRAAELSADPAAKVRRLTAGATAALDAGLWQQAEGLARRADRPQDEEVAAELARVRATLAFQAGRPLEATRLLQEGAELIAAADPVSALTMLGLASVYVWSSRTHPDQVPLARRTEELTPRLDGPLGAVHALNHGMRRLLEGDLMAAITGPGLRSEESVPVDLRLLAAYRGFMRGDQHAMLQDATRLVAECRTAGRAGRLPQAMMLLALAQLTNGRHHAARESAADGIHIAEDVGQPYWHDYLTGLAAWLAGVAGEEERCRELVARADDVDGAWMTGLGWGTYALIALDLAAGRHTAVLERMDQALAGPARHAFLWWYACPDYVEAAARAGTPERARPAFTRFRDWANVIDQPWAHAVLKRCEALLSGDGDGYARALALHRQADQPFEQARTELLYGEWLRRHQRRAEARTHLRAAMEGFERLGAAPWAKRAATELRAAGASLSDRRHAEDPLAALTPQELQVVRLAATGASNREIGAHLFLSPRTVAYHLYKAFPKLGITSRGELAQYVTVI
ncbi:helix-turn-helix transcriptional regulator [Nonomuraea sp. NPDC003727]